jgi:hypothetical protein
MTLGFRKLRLISRIYKTSVTVDVDHSLSKSLWRSIGITFQCNCGHGNDWAFGKTVLQAIILRLAFNQSEALTIIMDHDADMIWIIEGRCTAMSAYKTTYGRQALGNPSSALLTHQP